MFCPKNTKTMADSAIITGDAQPVPFISAVSSNPSFSSPMIVLPKPAPVARSKSKTYASRSRARTSAAPRRATPAKKSKTPTSKIRESSEEPSVSVPTDRNPSFSPPQGQIDPATSASKPSSDMAVELSTPQKSTLLSVPGEDISPASFSPSSPNMSAREFVVTSGKDFEILEELCRKKGLKRVLAVIQDDENTESEVEKIPVASFTKESMTHIFDQGKKLISSIEKLQRFFNNMKEKLFRARCNGMDQGIEDVMRGVSPFLEQHMQKINKSYQEELTKAKELQEVRIRSINLEYETAVRAVWASVELELERKQRVQKVKIVEKMIKNECDLMHNQLRHACTRWKDALNKGGPAPKTVNGIAVSTGTEASIEESAADLWKLMKLSIRQKYYNKYLSPEAEARTADQERVARNSLIQKLLFDSPQESGAETKAVNGTKGERQTAGTKRSNNGTKGGAKRKKISGKGRGAKTVGVLSNTVVEEFQEQVLQLDMLNDLPGVQISIPDCSDTDRSAMTAEFF